MSWTWDTSLGSARLIEKETGVPILTAIPGIAPAIPTVAVNSEEWQGPPYQLAEVQGGERIARLIAEAPDVLAERDKLKRFKDYVHSRLDAAGVPTDPDSPHKAEGCRIGGRLDVVLARCDILNEILKPGSPAPPEVKAKLLRELQSRTEDGEHEWTRESLTRCVEMIDTWAPDCFPANESGQIDFARAMMECVAGEIRAFLKNLAAEQEAKPNG
jgi:hypothetical protein